MRRAGGSVPNATALSGMKHKPIPMPWMNPEVNTYEELISSDHPAICQNESTAKENPVITILRGSIPMRSKMLDSCILISVPTPRGISAHPVSTTEYPNSRCNIGGNKAIVANITTPSPIMKNSAITKLRLANSAGLNRVCLVVVVKWIAPTHTALARAAA